jgi:dihydroorotase
METNNGILYKMNPPLREPGAPQKLVELLRNGEISWIETDHAPHTYEEKTSNGYVSGLPGLPWWPLFDEFLVQRGFTEQQRRKVTFDNAAERFGIDITRRVMDVKDLSGRTEYAFNPYRALEETLGWK